MAETLIARTYAEGLRPLGGAAQRNHGVISQAVEARLSRTHALMFSEPLPDPDGVATDWYAQIEGPVRRLDELGAEEAEAARNRIGALTGGVLELAAELEAAGTEADRRLGEALRNAVEVPDVDAVWLVGDQPVLASWAHSRDIDKAPRGVIRRFVPRRPPPPPPPPPVPPMPAAGAASPGPWNLFWWLGWLVFAILLFWALYLLIAPCGLRGPAFLNFDTCPRAETRQDAETDRRAALEDRIAALERQLAEVGRACVPAPAPAPAPESEPDPESAEGPGSPVDAVVNEGGEIGAVNVILTWSDRADLDLAVWCPTGQKIWHRQKVVCGGELDIDANALEKMSEPVENVVFGEAMQPGTYRVEVFLYHQKEEAGKAEHNFRVTIIVDGEETVHDASVSMDNRTWTASFDYGGS